MKNELISKKRENRILFIMIGIVLGSSLFWRFYNYAERWTLSQDQARDGIIGLYAIQNFAFPLIGPPSSAGAFSFGPFYYWLIALFTLVIPVVNGPWIGFTLLSVITTLLFFYIGTHFGGKFSGLLFGLLASFSSEFIFHSSDMLNPIPIAFLTTISFLLIIKIVDQKKLFFSFYLGIIIGIAINFHLQALGLLAILPAVSYFNLFKPIQKLKVFGLSLLGMILAFIPLIIFNFSHHNILFQNILRFLTSNENKTGSSNNLLIDVISFWPQLWGTTIAHLPLLGYGCILLFLFAGILSLGDKRTLTKSFYVISITLLFQILFLFIYQGVRSPIYLIVFHAFFVFLTGWIVLNFYQFNRYVGIGLLIILLIITIPANIKIVQNNGSQVSTIMLLKQKLDLTNSWPILYSDSNSSMISLPLYYLYLKEKPLDKRMDIVACENKIIKDTDGVLEKWSCPMDIQTIAEEGNYKLYDLYFFTSEQQKQFFRIDSGSIYNSLYIKY